MGRHPSLSITGSRPGMLRGRCVVLGVTGGAAAYRAVDIARSLMRLGAAVRVVMTASACRLVSPTLLHWATGREPVVELTGGIEHVSLARSCDCMVVAPATLHTLAEIAAGEASSPVSATAHEFLGLGKPVVAAPSMHGGLYESLRRLRLPEGVVVLDPLLEEGKAKLPPVEAVAWAVEAVAVRGRDADGLRILVTAGPTREYIDDVRFISNPSTGLMGFSLAFEAYARGARVTLIHGPLSLGALEPLYHYLCRTGACRCIGVESTDEMADAVASESQGVDIAFHAAAPADYAPTERRRGKLDSRAGLVLELRRTRSVLGESRARVNVAFTARPASSMEELASTASLRLEDLGADIVAANPSSTRGWAGFSSTHNMLAVAVRGGPVWLIPRTHKRVAARRLLDIALAYYYSRRCT